MGKLPGGIDYDMIGRTGNHVGRRVRGVNIISMRAAKSDRPPTAAQLVPRLKLGLITHWLKEISPFIKFGFEDFDQEMSAWNACVKYNINNAVSGVSPAFTINYPMVLFSRGRLSKGRDVVMATTEDAQLDFSWVATVPSLMIGGPTDRLALIVYNPAKQDWAVSIGDAMRSSLSYDLGVPSAWSGDQVYPFVCFVSADDKEVSTSQFMGAVVVQ